MVDGRNTKTGDQLDGLGFKDQVHEFTRGTAEHIAQAELVPAQIVSSISRDDESGESEHKERGKSSNSKRRTLRLFAGVGLLVVCGAIGGSLVATKVLSRQTITSPTSPVASTPTPAPTLSRNVTIQNLLSSLYELEEVPGTEDSPQQRAASWLLLDQADEESSASDSRVLTRYALAVLYYATAGEMWAAQANFVRLGRHECDWNIGAKLGTRCDSTGDLVAVSLPNNRLVGTLPTEIGLLTTLNFLQLRGSHNNGNVNPQSNFFGGTLPTEIGNLEELIQLDISGSGPLQGSIPTEIGNLQNLVELRLNDINLTGSIPDVIGNMESLTFADFDNNLLSEAPESLANIQCISVRGNNLASCFLDVRRLQISIETTTENCSKYSPPCELPEL